MDDSIYFMARSQHLAAIHVICLVVAFIAHRRFHNRNRLPSRAEMLHRQKVREELLHSLSTSGLCRKLIRMSEDAFMTLCQKLQNEGGLKPTQRMSVEEQVARFLHIVGNDLKATFISWLYRRSESATSRHFHRVMNAIIALEDQYIRQPNGDVVQKEVQENKRFYPYFKNCIGAIDGTHVRVRVPNKDAPRYRGRKGYPTINILAACTFDLKFTYVLSGWEGTASDSRIIKDALTRDDKLLIPDVNSLLKMGTDGSKQLKGPVIPPSDLAVQKFTESRALELESLYSTIASQLNNDFKSQRNKRRRTTSFDNRASKSRFRKKQKMVVSSHNSDGNTEKNVKNPPRHVRRRKELTKNPESGFCTSGDGTKRLRTHVWHAKRFTMTKRWGFHLPLGLHGSGRGSRALLKWLKNGTIVHDASYHSAVQLEGSQDSLLSVLSNVMPPFSSPEAEDVLSGFTYASSMLHHSGAPNSGTIAPVIYMWRPHHQSADADEENGRTNGFTQLWIWIHAAALTEGYNALITACESQGKMDEGVPSVKCTLLEGQFGTLEVMGSQAFQLLQKILHPVSSMSENSSDLEKCSLMEADGITLLTNTSILKNEEHTPCSGIIPLVVSDPRALIEKSTKFDLSYTDLWDVGKGLCCPVEESVLCMEKHHQRLSSFCLADKSSDGTNLAINMHSSRICPVILLRRNNLKDSITRWSIILPLSWIKAFWVPLVSIGAQAIGLRERSWVACEAGIPNFPFEFPECSSYSSLMQAEAADVDKQAALRPISVRPFSIPIPPPWNCVRLAFVMNATKPESTQICSSELNSVTAPALVDNRMVVARSSRMLADFLNAINGDRLPLFSVSLDKNNSISKIIKDENILNQGPNTASFLENQDRKLCFVRVILHTFNEGVIEDGAIVCAPRLADINLWASGSINKAALQVPQSSMSTYFVKQSSGKWEFRVPEDPAAVESNRWPIGFVTNGFVRGSKKPAAGALCDAVLLAHLRHEQWSSVPLKQRKKEIYVLTRNLRSTAYRLALASIVLEHQEEDLDHI